MQVTEGEGCRFPAILSDRHPLSSPFCHPTTSSNQQKLLAPAGHANSAWLRRQRQAAARSLPLPNPARAAALAAGPAVSHRFLQPGLPCHQAAASNIKQML